MCGDGTGAGSGKGWVVLRRASAMVVRVLGLQLRARGPDKYGCTHRRPVQDQLLPPRTERRSAGCAIRRRRSIQTVCAQRADPPSRRHVHEERDRPQSRLDKYCQDSAGVPTSARNTRGYPALYAASKTRTHSARLLGPRWPCSASIVATRNTRRRATSTCCTRPSGRPRRGPDTYHA
ncbi:hypothetical protein HYPSUDRAFT_221363 [Hypholoma sublateritium FD-334 SS-4]|uniref:Uncharacterized protein n=1 Tax=Hypholoma sublateritium (strain FD-334 SS-4) TaxID=945553 RepID=A0A0D2LN79_HYPSF|nr:hypothetical protein HYPSUDRAFT_221363 [Hypholoma sublateritium FD-334 SS-4]